MAKMNTARDGKMAHCFLLVKAAEKATKMEEGRVYAIFAKGASTTIDENLQTHRAFYCNNPVATLAEGDEVWEYSPKFLGFANDKSMDMSKEVTEATCDKDKSTNYVMDGTVDLSLSISGLDLLGTSDSGLSLLRQRFRDYLDTSGEAVEYIPAQTTIKDFIMLVWDKKDATTGGTVGIDFAPGFVTSLNREASYNSPQSASFDFQGCDTTDDGVHGQYQQARWAGLPGADVE